MNDLEIGMEPEGVGTPPRPSWIQQMRPWMPLLAGAAALGVAVLVAIGLVMSKAGASSPPAANPRPAPVAVAAAQPPPSAETPAVAPPASTETGFADILSIPALAVVRMGGTVVGQTPLRNLEVRVGSYPLTITLGGRQAWEGTLVIEAGRRVEIRVELPPASASR